MRILFITPYLPYPPHHGGSIRVFELLRRLVERHPVTLASLMDTAEERAHVPALEALGMRVLVAPKPPVRQAASAKLQRLLSPQPRLLRELVDADLQRGIADLIRARAVDLVHCENLESAHLAGGRAGVPRVLAEQAITHTLYERIAAARETPVTRLAGALDALKVRRYEQRVWREFEACITVNAEERDVVLRAAPQAHVYVVPNGVDTTAFRPSTTPRPPATIIMTGSLDYFPNADGMQWFVSDIWPRIRQQAPAVEFMVVGKSTPEVDRSLSGVPALRLVGRVPDVRPYVAQATLFVVPLRIGGGTRLKILEALAQGIPVVSTSVGCEGLALVHDEHLLVADSATDFVAAVLRLMADAALRDRLAQNGRRLVEQRYDWDRIVGGLEEAYQATIERHLGSREPGGTGVG